MLSSDAQAPAYTVSRSKDSQEHWYVLDANVLADCFFTSPMRFLVSDRHCILLLEGEHLGGECDSATTFPCRFYPIYDVEYLGIR